MQLLNIDSREECPADVLDKVPTRALNDLPRAASDEKFGGYAKVLADAHHVLANNQAHAAARANWTKWIDERGRPVALQRYTFFGTAAGPIEVSPREAVVENMVTVRPPNRIRSRTNNCAAARADNAKRKALRSPQNQEAAVKAGVTVIHWFTYADNQLHFSFGEVVEARRGVRFR